MFTELSFAIVKAENNLNIQSQSNYKLSYMHVRYYEIIKYDFEEFLFTRENADGLKRGEEAEYKIRYNLLSQISKYVYFFKRQNKQNYVIYMYKSSLNIIKIDS